MVLRALFVALLALDDVPHVESALAALTLASETVFVEGVAAHEVDGGEGETVLAVGAVVGQEGLGCCFEFFELAAALVGFLDVLSDDLLVLLDVEMVFFQST